jgi:1-aminocyclopropane-1-carboxylate deaminase/D-cysteine desulfhydrase-like pyridoxal-dependent ACC family enzyme
MREVLEQGADPHWVVFATSSGGTHAGLVAGARLFGYKGNILGISIDEPEGALQDKVAILATATAEEMGENETFYAADIRVNADYLGAGYGAAGPPEVEAIHLFARQEGILLDPVYTGRAAAGLIDLIRRGFFSRKQTVLFWHTGGVPALFADTYQGLLS